MNNLIVGTHIDITDRMVAEEVIIESESKYRTLADSGQALIWTSGTDKKYDYFNKTWLQFTGRTPDQELGDGWAEGVHPEDRAHCMRIYSDAFDKRQRFSLEYRLHHASGEYRWIQDDGSPRFDTRGNFLGYIGHCLDVTRHKQAEEELKRRENILQKIFDVLPVGLWFTDENGKFLRGNSAGVKIWGADLNSVPSENGFIKGKRLPSGEKVTQNDWALARTIKEKVAVVDEMLEIDAFDGMKKIILNYTALVLDDNESIEGVIVVNLDITRLKEAEEKLRHTLASLRKALAVTIQVLVSAVEMRDPYTAGHQTRSADLARAIATELGLPHDMIECIRVVGVLHDIGKLSVPAEILSKPTKLTHYEFALIKEHVQKGFDILKDIESPWALAEIVYQHHERMDGSGYPRNLKGDEIMMEARIMAVADVVESMASHRPYRPALGIDEALAEIEKNSGTLYDHNVVDACLRLFREKGFQLAKI